MDYQDFISREEAYDGFVFYRKEVLESAENGTFGDIFTELCTRALDGDAIAQDVAAYFFKRGIPGLLVENYDYYMGWQILAGANGNEFALEKLEFFLDVGLDSIIGDDNVLAEAMRKKNIAKNNAILVISNLLCEGIVDELKINPKSLVQLTKKPVEYSPERARRYTTALEKCVANVVKFLIS